MARYVDGFVFVVPRKNLKAYRRMAATAGKVWREHGAVEYLECIGDDLNTRCGTKFPRLMKLKRGEAAFFSWVLYKSKKHRDRVNAKVMKDPRILAMIDPKDVPFDMKRMSHGGFEAMVDL
jgi:uncharacterized protein YbaA (DUF1428 family)